MSPGDRKRFVRLAATIMGGLIVALVALGGRTAAVRPAANGSLPDSVPPSVIPNYSLLTPDVAVAGQPTEAGLGQLGALGFRVVIDLRAPSEGTAAEEAAVKAAGLRYVSVPVTAETLRREDAEAVATILGERGRGPVLLHCSTGNRVGAVWTVLQVTKGVPYEDAEAEGRKIGLRSGAMVAAVRRVVDQLERR